MEESTRRRYEVTLATKRKYHSHFRVHLHTKFIGHNQLALWLHTKNKTKTHSPVAFKQFVGGLSCQKAMTALVEEIQTASRVPTTLHKKNPRPKKITTCGGDAKGMN